MKNWEFHEEEVKEYGFTFGMKNNKIYSCRELYCTECAFYTPGCLCTNSVMKWLYEEHKEPVVLTDDEKALCKLLGRGWIARDKDDSLYQYENKPRRKSDQKWLVCDGLYNDLSLRLNRIFPQCKFEFVKWEDEEPWEVKVDD